MFNAKIYWKILFRGNNNKQTWQRRDIIVGGSVLNFKVLSKFTPIVGMLIPICYSSGIMQKDDNSVVVVKAGVV